ncbi:hypothetical protein BGY98DRAFT_1038793 [Russula aff. rugulosa BPL654]|nr:hypothetical protein BGY98DRAFT_1038793 [Russula aff. rugulosa BPL654]
MPKIFQCKFSNTRYISKSASLLSLPHRLASHALWNRSQLIEPCRSRYPLLNLASPLFASTRSDPCSPPVLPLMATSGFPLPAQSRSVHPMQTSWAEATERTTISSEESIVCLVLVPRSPLPPIISIGPFPRIFTLRILPVMTMNDHPYASASTSTRVILSHSIQLHILRLANSLQSKIRTRHLSLKASAKNTIT